MPRKSRFTKEMKEWLVNNRSLRGSALESGFWAEFGVHEPRQSLYCLINSMGYTKRNMMTDEKLEFLKANYPNCENTYDLLETYNKKFNENVSLFNLQVTCERYKINRNRHNIRMYQRSEIGHEYTDSDGIVLIKVRPEVNTSKSYITKTKYMYQKYHNVELTKSDIVIQLDGDRLNFDKDNLVLVTKGEFISLVGYGWLNKGIVTKAGLEWIRSRNECNKYIHDKHKRI